MIVAVATAKRDLATEAWALALELVFANRERFMAAAHELKLPPMQAHTLRLLERPRSMSELAEQLQCDASNVTGIVDRLEARGFVERIDEPGDRRVKKLRLTAGGAAARARFLALMHEPPPAVEGLACEDLRTLRDVLRRALAKPQ